MKILCVNAGSSSLKFQMYEMPEEKVLISGLFERIGINDSLYRAYFNIYNLNMDIYPLDYELMSLEDDNCFHQLYITNNYNSLF